MRIVEIFFRKRREEVRPKDRYKSNGGDPRSGLLLVVMVGLLTLLLVLAVAFAALARAERVRTSSTADQVRAKLLTRAGGEYALARLTEDPDFLTMSPGTSPSEDWRYRDDPGVPLGVSRNPSYNQDPYFDADLNDRYSGGDSYSDPDGNNRYDGWSGRLRGAHASYSDRFKLRIESANGKLHVNGGLLDAQDRDGDGVADHRDPDVSGAKNDVGLGWNRQLTRILDRLGEELGIAGLGTRVLSNRPLSGFRSVQEVSSRVGIDLSPYLSTAAWVDESVIHPNGFVPPEGKAFPAGGDWKAAREVPRPEEKGRAPVSFHSARPELVRALCRDLSAVVWNHWSGGEGEVRDIWLSKEESDWVSAELFQLRRREAVDGWNRFHAFCDALAQRGLFDEVPGIQPIGLSQQLKADLLKANFNPNSDLNKNLPDRILWRWVDKSDLMNYSTEFALEEAGLMSVESLGEVWNAGHLEGAGRLWSVIRLWERHVDTTQADFVGGRGAADYAGGTSGVSAVAHGMSVATYPEPHAVVHPATGEALPAEWDGQVALSTVEAPPVFPSATFLHHFREGWDADFGVETGVVSHDANARLVRDPRPTWGETAGTLYPDGGHVQDGRVPAFSSLNLPEGGGGGLAGMWVKSWGAEEQFLLHAYGEIGLDMQRDVSIIDTTQIDPNQPGSQWVDVLETEKAVEVTSPHTSFLGIGSAVSGGKRWSGFLVQDATLHSGHEHEEGVLREEAFGGDLGRWVLTGAWWRTVPVDEVAAMASW